MSWMRHKEESMNFFIKDLYENMIEEMAFTNMIIIFFFFFVCVA